MLQLSDLYTVLCFFQILLYLTLFIIEDKMSGASITTTVNWLELYAGIGGIRFVGIGGFSKKCLIN